MFKTIVVARANYSIRLNLILVGVLAGLAGLTGLVVCVSSMSYYSTKKVKEKKKYYMEERKTRRTAESCGASTLLLSMPIRDSKFIECFYANMCGY